MMNSVLIYIQLNEGKILSSTFEIVEWAHKICEEVDGVVVISEEKIPAFDEEVSRLGLKNLFVLSIPGNDHFELDVHKKAVLYSVDKLMPDVLLFPSTLEGRMLAPVVASQLKTGTTADCTDLKVDQDGLLLQTRPAFGGKVMASIKTPYTKPQIATVRQGILSNFIDRRIKPTIQKIKNDINDSQFEQIKIVSEIKTKEIEKNKDFIIAVGGGLKKKEDLKIFQKLAQIMDATLMCSRVLVERGWMSQCSQIGLSGQTVNSKVLFAFGISGSVQFLSGIKQVDTLCAINTDADADIFKMAEYPILGDLYLIAQEMLIQLNQNVWIKKDH